MWKTIVAGGIVLGLAGTVMLPSLCRPGETGKRAKCASNLHQIGLAVAAYAAAHGGRYPDTLAELIGAGSWPADTWVCPSTDDEPTDVAADVAAAEAGAAGHRHCLSYVYLGRGLTTLTVTDLTLVAYEPIANHRAEGFNALFGDGHAEFCAAAAWPKVAREGGLTDAAIAGRSGPMTGRSR